MALPNSLPATGKLFLNLDKTHFPAQVSWSLLVGGSWPSWTSAKSRGPWNPGGSWSSLFSHLPPPLLDSHRHAERDHHRLLYEPGLEGDFPFTPHPSESTRAQRGSEWGEGVPLCSLSQKIPCFPSSQAVTGSSLGLDCLDS